jgi:hypothetical protein
MAMFMQIPNRFPLLYVENSLKIPPRLLHFVSRVPKSEKLEVRKGISKNWPIAIRYRKRQSPNMTRNKMPRRKRMKKGFSRRSIAPENVNKKTVGRKKNPHNRDKAAAVFATPWIRNVATTSARNGSRAHRVYRRCRETVRGLQIK